MTVAPDPDHDAAGAAAAGLGTSTAEPGPGPQGAPTAAAAGATGSVPAAAEASGLRADPAPFPLPALRRLYAVAVLLGLASLLPYATPRLADHRYWERLDAAPLARAVGLAAAETPSDAVEAMQQAPSPEAELSASEVAKLAAGSPAGEGAAGPDGLPLEATPASALVVDPSVLGDQKVWLQGDLALAAPFFEALTALAEGRRSHVRIGHWGDSLIAADGMTHIARQLLQLRFGNGGHGFTLVTGRTTWYSHKGIVRSGGDSWRIQDFLNGNARDGDYGYGGVTVSGGAGSQFTLSTTDKAPATRIAVYHRSAGRAEATVKIDDSPPERWTIETPPGTDDVRVWQVPDGKHRITVRVVSGRLRVQGVAFERDQGLVYDSLGEVGARGLRWLNADAAHLQRVMALRAPDLLILNYGGNDRTDHISEATFTAKMGEVIERMRAGRKDVACILMGPSDHGVRKGGRVISDPGVVRITNWQRKLAPQRGCLFLDTRALMGGEGAMGRWVKQGLGWSDYAHLTAKGDGVLGQGLYRALLEAWVRWRKANGGPPRP